MYRLTKFPIKRNLLRTFTTSSISKNELVLPQSINRLNTWSKSQADKKVKMTGPRFEQTDFEAQPNPMSAIELIHEEPVREFEGRVVSCNGGGGALGHPKDQGKPVPCGYCGIRFQQKAHHH